MIAMFFALGHWIFFVEFHLKAYHQEEILGGAVLQMQDKSLQ
jgi:hypothetical protein